MVHHAVARKSLVRIWTRYSYDHVFRPVHSVRSRKMREPGTFLLFAVVIVGSFCHAQDQTVRDEQNRVAVEQIQAGVPVFDTRSPSILSRLFCRVMRGKIDSWNSVGIKYEIVLAICPINVNFKSRNRIFITCRQLPFCLRVGNICWPIGLSSPPPHIMCDNDNSEIFNFFTWNRCPRINFSKELISLKEFISRNRCLGFGLCIT